jgi:membrane protease YdiL (CAAX protease family)
LTSKKALPLSIVVIVSYWAFMIVRQLLRAPDAHRTANSIFVGACLRAAITAALVCLLLRAGGETMRVLGFTIDRPAVFARYTAALAAALFVVVNVVLNNVFANLVGTGSAVPPIAELFRDPRSAPVWVLSAIIGGGFGEELGRAFVLTRFEKAFGRQGLVAAVVVDCIVFGMGHLYQGRASAISTGFSGLAFVFIFLWRRRVIDAMAVHALFDLMGIAAAYALYAH